MLSISRGLRSANKLSHYQKILSSPQPIQSPKVSEDLFLYLGIQREVVSSILILRTQNKFSSIILAKL